MGPAELQYLTSNSNVLYTRRQLCYLIEELSIILLDAQCMLLSNTLRRAQKRTLTNQPNLYTIWAMADLSRTLPLERSSVQSAHKRIKEHIHLTPVLTSTTLSILASTPQIPETLIGTPFEGQRPAHPRINFFFKCENYQRTGAFKVRGAFHALSRLSNAELAKGVVTHSSGKAFTYGISWLI